MQFAPIRVNAGRIIAPVHDAPVLPVTNRVKTTTDAVRSHASSIVFTQHSYAVF